MLNYDLRENVYHGSSKFPVSLYTIDNETPDAQILPCHWHEDFEIIYVSRGIGHFKIDNSIYTLNKGQAIVVNSRELHSGYTTDNNSCDYNAFVFDIKFLENIIDDLCTENYIKPILLKQKRIENLLSGKDALEMQCLEIIRNLIMAYTERKPHYELFIKSQLYSLLFLLYSNNAVSDCKANNTNKPNVNLETIKEVLKYIDHNFSDRISIDTIAEIANLSKFHFIRVFKATTAMNPTEYINMIRINEAEKCFQTTSMNITEVASFCGFNNLSYFIKIFKNYKKITPYKYKKIYTEFN